jgi:hypothetical protein
LVAGQKGKFDRSRWDMEKVMHLARADDPEATVEDERAHRQGCGTTPLVPASGMTPPFYQEATWRDNVMKYRETSSSRNRASGEIALIFKV